MAKIIKLGDVKYNAAWLQSITEDQAVRALPNKEHQQVRNAWKQANGKSVRNYAAEQADDKPKKRKRTTKTTDKEKK